MGETTLVKGLHIARELGSESTDGERESKDPVDDFSLLQPDPLLPAVYGGMIASKSKIKDILSLGYVPSSEAPSSISGAPTSA